MNRFAHSTGFTLIEILVVVVIIGIMATVGVQFIAVGQHTPEKQAQLLSKQLNFMCEKAVFENRPFALELTQSGHQFITHRKQQWFAIDDKQWPNQALQENIETQFYLNGRPQALSLEFDQKPHIICYPNGQLSSFELLFKDLLAEPGQSVYQLATVTPTQLTSGWLDES